MKTNIHLRTYLAQFFLEREVYQIKVVEKIKTHVLCLISFFENLAVYEIIWGKKHCRAGQTRDDNMAHAHCMLDT